MTVGCLVRMMGLGTNQNYIGGSRSFNVFARPAKACLPLSAPRGYFNFSLAEENSAKSYCFRGFKCLQSASLKMSGKCEMAMGPVVAVQIGSYLGLKSRGGNLPPIEFAGPAESCLFLLTSKPNSAAEFAAILSKRENKKENSVKSYCFRGIKCVQSASLKLSGKCEMAVSPVVAVRLGSYLGLKSRGGHCPPVEFAGPAELCLSLPDPHSLSTCKPNSAVEITAKMCTQFRILSKSHEGCVVILPNLKSVRMVQLSKANLKTYKSNPKDWLHFIVSGCQTYLCRFVTQPDRLIVKSNVNSMD